MPIHRLMNISYPQDLPVSQKKDEIQKAIAKNQVVIISGDTGSGKTTQIPKICLELFPESTRVIGCTQPRRIAASSVSARVTEELSQYPNIVGYKIRFHDYTSPETRIKFMTDGVLLAETRNDPFLKKYEVIVLDEAHERSLNIDFLLGYLKQILPSRPDLKLIVTSATIDTEAFAKHFDNAPVISVSGRTYPVTVHYSPKDTEGDETSSDDEGYVEHCAEEILRIYNTEPPGDILAFLPTEKDIRACCTLVAAKAENCVVLPMFGRLQSADQRRIFQRHPVPKIVIATNVAETSITVPGIRYVVDSGYARMSFYNARAKTTSLPIQRISQASCDQRKGRCGRVGPGICVRLYSEDDYQNRDEFTLPEIKRANLAEVILQMVSLNLGKPEDFPFIDPPNRNAIRDGYRLLVELGAITSKNRLTPEGEIMAHLPIDPCISRILLEARTENCLHEVTIIASALAIQDPRIRPAEKEQEADNAHRNFAHKHSDFMSLLNLWNHFQLDQGENRSWSRLKKYCKAHFLSFQRMREWVDLHEQLIRILKRRKDFTINNEDASYQQIHKALASGFLRNIAVKKQAKIYQGASNRELMIFPGSHQFLSAGQWIIAASFLETNRLYALTVASIEPDWLESLASHLVKYSWSNPRWNKKSGQVVAEEKVSLFGLTIIAGRVVNFGKRDKKNISEARDIFIQSALIEGGLQGNYKFLAKNTNTILEWRKAEDKLRTTAIVQDDTALFEFYNRQLPAHVYDRTTLNRVLKKRGHNFLTMSEEDVLLNKPDENQLADYPPTLSVGSVELQLDYSFKPGEEIDGVTVRIPHSLAPTLAPATFEWLVPGLLREKLHLLLKGLPKAIRKHLVPLNLTVDRILDDIVPYKGSLFHALESSIHKMFRIQVARSDWPTTLPAHLQARFLLFDINGKDISSGRDLNKLIQSIESKHKGEIGRAEVAPDNKKEQDRWEGTITREWAFDGLPETIPLMTPTNDIAGFLYPVLIPKPDKGSVQVSFVNDKKKAKQTNIEGVEYLYRLQFPDGFKSLKKYCTSLLSGPSATFLISSGLDKKKGLDQMLRFVMKSLFQSIDGTIPSKALFEEETTSVKNRGFYRSGKTIAETAINVLKKRKEVTEGLQKYIKLDNRNILFTKEKISEFNQLMDELVPHDFFTHHSMDDIELAIRQLQSLAIRIERYYANPAKDGEKAKRVLPHLENLRRIEQKKNELSEEASELLDQYRNMVAEFRITTFSPEIKTRISVSEKKLKMIHQELLAKF